jgi:lipoprotein-releasing system permease protein
MNVPYFIARRVAASGQPTFSRLILRIAVAAVAISVAVMIIATSLIAGFKEQISRKVFGFWGHIHITDTNIGRTVLESSPVSRNQPFYPSLDTLGPVPYQSARRVLGMEFWGSDRTTGGVRHIQVFAFHAGVIKAGDAIEGILLKGVGFDFDWAFMKEYIKAGRALRLPDTIPSREILISRQTADRLQVGVGDRFIVHVPGDGNMLRRRFEVSGIYRTGLEEYDKRFALVDIRQIQQLKGWPADQVSGFEVFVDDVQDVEVLADYIYTELLPQDLYAETIREKLPEIFEWLDLQDINEIVILTLMQLVAIINMITALLILILERTNMIGTLKALGGSNWQIRRIFLYYAGYIIVLGLFWGNLIGLGLCVLQQQFGFIQLDETNYYLSVAPIKFRWGTILLLNIGTLLITLIFLVLPSWLVSRIDPVKAIRFK